LIDAAFNSGVANAQPPPPAPVTSPEPPPPAPVFTPPPPTPEKIVKAEPVKPPDKLSPDNLEPVKTAKTEPRKIQINTQLVTRTAPKEAPMSDNSQQQQRQARAIRSALQNLKSNLTPGTTIEAPGNGSVAYASYDSVVKSIYEQAWVPPDKADNDEANAKVSVTIANDGTVISARIVTPSGDAGVDASVQRTLSRVTFIAPFPKGATEKERTYIINFNLKTKRLLG
jgi:TonB family protein